MLTLRTSSYFILCVCMCVCARVHVCMCFIKSTFYLYDSMTFTVDIPK